MAQRMNHAKRNLQARINKEHREYRRNDAFDGSIDVDRISFQTTIRNWATFGLKSCRGKSAAWIFFEKIQTFRWMVREDIPIQNIPSDYRVRAQRFSQWRDIKKVAFRAKFILLPFARRETAEFVWIKDQDGAFEKIEMAGRGARISLSKGSRVVKRTTEIDITSLHEFDHHNVSFDRLVACVKTLFGLTPVRYENFFDDDSNFNMKEVAKLESWERR